MRGRVSAQRLRSGHCGHSLHTAIEMVRNPNANVSSVLISMAPLWVILLGASSLATYLLFVRKVIK